MSSYQQRAALMVRLGTYFTANPDEWQAAKDTASRQNAWFTPDYIDQAITAISRYFLSENRLNEWLEGYKDFGQPGTPLKKVGLVMAGNIPLVGFHDFLCCYLSGHELLIKLSSKDTVLWQHILSLIKSWDAAFERQVRLGDILSGCDAYIATGSNNTARYFEQYFAKYPHIIRRNRTSVAILNGTETAEALQLLADDICCYFGMGCRNVTQVFVPQDYNFSPLLHALSTYKEHMNKHKYKNNYDYQLTLMLLNKIPYQTEGNILLVPSDSPFAPISVLHYDVYQDRRALETRLQNDDQIQCIVGDTHVPFGHSQRPSLKEYADGVDTIAFLMAL